VSRRRPQLGLGRICRLRARNPKLGQADRSATSERVVLWMRRSRRALVGMIVGCGVGGLATTSAEAYLHSQVCPHYTSAQVCWSGDGYHSNTEVVLQIGAYGNPAFQNEVCAKAVTAAGNIRTGSGCAGAGFATSQRVSCLVGGTPDSAAYGYYGGSAPWLDDHVYNAAGTEHLAC
jgi:hypothetical protein